MSFDEKPIQQQQSQPNAKPRYSFVDSYLGLVVMGAVLVIILMVGSLSEVFFLPMNLHNVFLQFAPYAAIAFAVILTTRAKGPDFSLGSIMAFSGIVIAQSIDGFGSIGGLFLALVICAVIGLINGVLTVYLRIPAIVVTVIMSAIVRIMTMTLSGGAMLPLHLESLDITIAAVMLLVVCFAAAFLLICFSKLGIPLRERDSKPRPINKYVVATLVYLIVQARILDMLQYGVLSKYSPLGVSPTEILFYGFIVVLIILLLIGRRKSGHANESHPVSYVMAYVISAVTGGLAGFYMLLRLRAAIPTVGSGYELFILFVFACAYSTKLVDNRYTPAVYALAPALVWACVYNFLAVYGITVYLQQYFFVGIMLVFFGIAYAANRKQVQAHLAGKSQKM